MEQETRARDRQAALRAELGTQAVVDNTPETTEEEPRIIAYLPLGTSEEEPVCENACSDRLHCKRVHARYTCLHLQCIRTHFLVGSCIACGCSELRFDREIPLPLPGSSASGPAIPENEAEPEGEPKPENTPEPIDPFSRFITSEY